MQVDRSRSDIGAADAVDTNWRRGPRASSATATCIEQIEISLASCMPCRVVRDATIPPAGKWAEALDDLRHVACRQWDGRGRARVVLHPGA